MPADFPERRDTGIPPSLSLCSLVIVSSALSVDEPRQCFIHSERSRESTLVERRDRTRTRARIRRECKSRSPKRSRAHLPPRGILFLASRPTRESRRGGGGEKNVREATVSLCVTLLIAALAAPQLGSLDSVDATGGRACAKSHGITKSFGLNTEKPSLLRRNAVAYLPAGARPRRIFRIASRR